MSSRSLARELLAERARKQKTNASDRAAIHLNRYYGSKLAHTIEVIVSSCITKNLGDNFKYLDIFVFVFVH